MYNYRRTAIKKQLRVNIVGQRQHKKKISNYESVEIYRF